MGAAINEWWTKFLKATLTTFALPRRRFKLLLSIGLNPSFSKRRGGSTPTDRISAGLSAAYFAYRLWLGWGDGVIYGDVDMDVHTDRNPTAFVLTALSVVTVIVICAFIALASSADDLAAMIAWLWKV